MKSNNLGRQIYGLLFIAVLLIAIFFAVAASLDMFIGLEMPATINWQYIFIAFICHVLYLFIASKAWQFNVKVYSSVKLPLFHSFAQISMVLVGKYIPGKFWGFAIRGADLTTRGVSGYQMLMSSYAEQLVSIHAGFFIGAGGWLLFKQPQFFEIALVVLVTTSLAAPFLNNHFFATFLNFCNRFWKKNISGGEVPANAYYSLFLFYVLEWFFIGGILVFLYLSLYPAAISIQSLLFFPAANSLAFIAGFIAIFAPGGIGVRDGLLVALLAGIIGLPEALYLSIIFRIWLVFWDAVAGLMSIKVLVNKN